MPTLYYLRCFRWDWGLLDNGLWACRDCWSSSGKSGQGKNSCLGQFSAQQVLHHIFWANDSHILRHNGQPELTCLGYAPSSWHFRSEFGRRILHPGFHPICAVELLLWPSMFEYDNVVMTTVHEKHKKDFKAGAEGMGDVWNLMPVVLTKSFTGDGPSSTDGDSVHLAAQVGCLGVVFPIWDRDS